MYKTYPKKCESEEKRKKHVHFLLNFDQKCRVMQLFAMVVVALF